MKRERSWDDDSESVTVTATARSCPTTPRRWWLASNEIRPVKQAKTASLTFSLSPHLFHIARHFSGIHTRTVVFNEKGGICSPDHISRTQVK